MIDLSLPQRRPHQSWTAIAEGEHWLRLAGDFDLLANALGAKLRNISSFAPDTLRMGSPWPSGS